jgi:beta-ribofuranosylaminobenzene 5'-phosphate synthase
MNSQVEHERGSRQPRDPRALGVTAPGRLHIGFLDLNGSLGRRFGSIGVAVERPVTRLKIETADALSAEGPDAARAVATIETLARAVPDFDPRLKVTVEEALPAHAGLGSGTQLALAVGVGASRVGGVPMTPHEVARAIGRGMRSAIGLGAFEGGGVLLDGGQPVAPEPGDHRPPPLLSRVSVPEKWRFLLIFDEGMSGLSGGEETRAMGRLPVFPEALADRLCRLTLMTLMPAASLGDAVAFGRAASEIQRRLGDHFSQFQGGRFTSPDVSDALSVSEAEGATGVGQSSWGPTGFAIFGDPASAEAAAARLRARFADRRNLRFDVVRGNNHGAVLTELSDAKAGQDNSLQET